VSLFITVTDTGVRKDARYRTAFASVARIGHAMRRYETDLLWRSS
jgi:hypothetical protein